jgi:hypothetical protein
MNPSETLIAHDTVPSSPADMPCSNIASVPARKSVSLEQVENGFTLSLNAHPYKTYVFASLDEAITQLKTILTA